MGGKSFTPDFKHWGYGTDQTDANWDLRVNEDFSIMLDHTLAGDQQFQFRASITETGGADGNTTDDWTVQYRINGGTWTTPTGATTGVQVDTGSALTDGNATTEQLSNGETGGGGGAFTGGVQEAGNAEVTNFQLTGNDYTELCYALLLIAADLSSGDLLEFRLLLNGATFAATAGVPAVMVNDGPIIRGVTWGRNGTFDQTIVATTPTGTVQDDLLIVQGAIDNSTGSNTWGSQADWTEIYDNDAQTLLYGAWWRIAPATPAATYTFTASSGPTGGEDDSWVMFRIDGHDATSPVHQNAINTGSSSTPSGSSVTTTVTDCMILSLVQHAAADASATVAAPTGTLTYYRTNDDTTIATGSNSQTGNVNAFSVKGTTGATGTASWNTQNTSDGWQVATLAIQPQQAAGAATVSVSTPGALSIAAPGPTVQAGAAIAVADPATLLIAPQGPTLLQGAAALVSDPASLIIQPADPTIQAGAAVFAGPATVVLAAPGPTIDATPGGVQADVNVSDPVQLVLRAEWPTIQAGATVFGDVAAVLINAIGPTIQLGSATAVDAAALLFQGQGATVRVGASVFASPPSLTFTAPGPTIQRGATVFAGPQTLVITAPGPTVSIEGGIATVTVDTATFSLVPGDPTVVAGSLTTRKSGVNYGIGVGRDSVRDPLRDVGNADVTEFTED